MNETPTLSDLIDFAMAEYGYDQSSAYAFVAGSLFALASDDNKQLIARSMNR